MQIGLSDFPELASRVGDGNAAVDETIDGALDFDAVTIVFSPDEEADNTSQPNPDAFPEAVDAMPEIEANPVHPVDVAVNTIESIKGEDTGKLRETPSAPIAIFERENRSFHWNLAGSTPKADEARLPKSIPLGDIPGVEIRGMSPESTIDTQQSEPRFEKRMREEPTRIQPAPWGNVPLLASTGQQSGAVPVTVNLWSRETNVEKLDGTASGTGSENRIESNLNRTLAPTPVLRPSAEVQSGIVQQVSGAISKLTDGKIELRLDPPELGRVTISFSSTDGGMTAQIIGEKQEVVDMLRRHAEVFARELTRNGIEGAALNFSLRDGGSDGKQNQNAEMFHSGEYFVQEPEAAAPPVPEVGNGLDVRF